MAAPAFAFTISRAAEILGEDEQLLWDLADEMDPEDSCLWIHGTEDQQTIAFTPAGMEYLRDLLAEHKRNRPPRGTERMVSKLPQIPEQVTPSGRYFEFVDLDSEAFRLG